MGALPTDPSTNPNKQAVIPLMKFSPVSAPTIKSARITNRNCSPNPNVIIIGMAQQIETDRITAPNRPPKSEDVNAALRARAAIPFLDKGNPSITVAWEPDVPGMPIKTAGKVSDVVVGANTPIIIASA